MPGAPVRSVELTHERAAEVASDEHGHGGWSLTVTPPSSRRRERSPSPSCTTSIV
ncbi:MAG: hypothetical protein AVDCRST_MAG30-3071 [uncultured Solirubrobacteraceae bacterium]|uniref:Uncharacterized protein n=1 Tax=uncultured Solirubrobacteraceae bacterium TaxID=1162706 RepID=A0A6J4TFV6_9ACTN|nr:MAG: hypothetical protein AVDCRST_MAG30-3071 [uncultured Solirubrobacteraceae bacterium]